MEHLNTDQTGFNAQPLDHRNSKTWPSNRQTGPNFPKSEWDYEFPTHDYFPEFKREDLKTEKEWFLCEALEDFCRTATGMLARAPIFHSDSYMNRLHFERA